MLRLKKFLAAISMIFIVSIGLSACTHKPMAFAEIVIKDPDGNLTAKVVAKRLEHILVGQGLDRLGPDGFSEITETPGPIDYSSDQFVVSLVDENDKVIVGVYEEASDFSESGIALISRLMADVENWRPGASVKFRKITPKPENEADSD
jgi:hypothetical protein